MSDPVTRTLLLLTVDRDGRRYWVEHDGVRENVTQVSVLWCDKHNSPIDFDVEECHAGSGRVKELLCHIGQGDWGFGACRLRDPHAPNAILERHMNEPTELVTRACVKCGHRKASLQYGLTRTAVYGEPPTLNATCRRCGYQWTEMPLDEVADIEYTGKQLPGVFEGDAEWDIR